MKFLLNLPLAVAALLQVWFASLVFMSAPWSGWSDGPSRGAMVLVMLEPVALAWILLLPAIAGSVFADAFDWLPVRRRVCLTGALHSCHRKDPAFAVRLRTPTFC